MESANVNAESGENTSETPLKEACEKELDDDPITVDTSQTEAVSETAVHVSKKEQGDSTTQEDTHREGVDNVGSENTKEVSSNIPETDNNVNLKNDNTESSETAKYDPKNVHYEGDKAIYTDPSSGCQYEWNNEKQEWALRNTVTYGFEDDTHTYTDADGTKFFWDKDKHAWFPKITDDFMAQYQMSYGFSEEKTAAPAEEKIKQEPKITEKPETSEKTEEIKGVKRKPSTPTWFEVDDNQNTKVYVSNLPEEYTEEEFVDLMQKCGLVMRDPATGKMKVKLYRNSDGRLKGDALCTYIRVESVDLALKLLDGYDFKTKKIKVERAKFQMKGEYDPKLKPKTKKRKEKQKLKKMQEKLFDWRPEKMIGERAKHERVVIVKNLFEPSMFDKDVSLILEFQQDLREECSKCGQVRKVMLYDRHPEGVAQINMSCPEEADECVNLLNDRWFGKRKITAQIWDGKTKYKIAETDAEISQRLDKWDQFLEAEDTSTEAK